MIKKLKSLITATNKIIERLWGQKFYSKPQPIDIGALSIDIKKRIINTPSLPGRAYQIIGYPRPPRQERALAVSQQPANKVKTSKNKEV